MFLIPPDSMRSLLSSEKYQAALQMVFDQFNTSLFSVKHGYTQTDSTQLLEVKLKKICVDYFGSGLKSKRERPKLYLTHDLDYLKNTMPLAMKSLISEKRWLSPFKANSFIQSICSLLEIDRAYSESSSPSTFFVYSHSPHSMLRYGIPAKLLDPSYRLQDDLFATALQIFNEKKVHLGMHGSFYSLTETGLFAAEKKLLESRIKNKITFHRMHWLNVNGLESMQNMHNDGISEDSSMGFNGKNGFRGGMCRTYEILLPNLNTIKEIPLVIMDGNLFNNGIEVREDHYAETLRYLELVAQGNGDVAIDFHERAADNNYRWVDLYVKLLQKAKELNFEIVSAQEVS